MTAVWTADRTWVAGELVTAAIMNQYVRDNLDFLKTPAAQIDNGSAVTTSSATLVDVTGSSVTLTSYGGGFDVIWNGVFEAATVGAAIAISLNVDSATERTFTYENPVSNTITNCSWSYHVAALAAGSHTFKIQTSSSSGSVTVTGYQIYVVERGA